MIRGLLSVLPKSLTSGIFSASSQCSSELLKCSSRNKQAANFTSLVPGAVNASQSPSQVIAKYVKQIFLVPKTSPIEQVRTVIKFSLKKGKRKTVRAIPKRFFRLHWGIWIRPMAGRKELNFKPTSRRNRLLGHVFCNATQSRMLDKMVNRFWRRPKYYIEDPYAPYQSRENFPLTRRKPWRPEGVDYE